MSKSASISFTASKDIGEIPTFEDKVAQRAFVMQLEPIYEQDFLDCSFGFRPDRSVHDAIRALRDAIMETGQRRGDRR